MATILWTQRQDIDPGQRRSDALAFDISRQRTVLVRGASAAGLERDAWEWDGRIWTDAENSGPTTAPCVPFDPVALVARLGAESREATLTVL